MRVKRLKRQILLRKHDYPLVDACPACHAPFASEPDASGLIGRCGCGHDLFQRTEATLHAKGFPTERATKALERYLAWCSAERSRRRLIAPASTGCWWRALAVLAEPPCYVLAQAPAVATDAHVRVPRSRHHPEPADGAFWPWVLMGVAPQFKMAQLPKHMLRPLGRITRTLARAIVAGDGSVRTRAKLDGDVLLMWNRQGLMERFLLPVLTNDHEASWMHLSTVMPQMLTMCGALLEAVDRHISGPTEPTAKRSGEDVKSHALDAIAGRGQLEAALCHLLLRGYAAGLATIMQRHFADEFRNKSALSWRWPVLELIGTKRTGIEAVRVCWTRGGTGHICGQPLAQAS